MLGRDLRPIAELQHRLVKAQLALEKDYETHRDYETRYRVVMEASRDAFVLVDVASRARARSEHRRRASFWVTIPMHWPGAPLRRNSRVAAGASSSKA
jgi:hypothetical protein